MAAIAVQEVEDMEKGHVVQADRVRQEVERRAAAGIDTADAAAQIPAFAAPAKPSE